MMSAIATIRIGKLSTVPLQDHDSPDKEVGQFEMPVDLGKAMFLRQGDKSGYVKNMIAHHLASAIESTRVPAEYWQFHMVDSVAKEFNFPSHFNFKVKI
tara:strand:+ start:2667 stop:2963 length:297 start_codon:yes stop_codon:yes gene_type:complete